MADEKITEEKKADESTVTETAVSTAAAEAKTEAAGGGKKKILSENAIEIIVAVFLGLTAILTAWASWIGSLHGGNQSTNYTKSNNLASEGNSEYNAALQLYLSDLMAYNTAIEYIYDKEVALANDKQAEADLIQEKLDEFIVTNFSPQLAEAWDWALDDPEANSPFEKPGFNESYYVTANELLEESRALLKEGQQDNANGDAYNLVNVIYSLVLFMLGIVGIFKRLPNRAVVLLIAIIALILATIYMITIPMPTGFSFSNFF